MVQTIFEWKRLRIINIWPSEGRFGSRSTFSCGASPNHVDFLWIKFKVYVSKNLSYDLEHYDFIIWPWDCKFGSRSNIFMQCTFSWSQLSVFLVSCSNLKGVLFRAQTKFGWKNKNNISSLGKGEIHVIAN